MRIVRLRICNYRCVRSLDFQPLERNILIGQVNSGKSTVLQALALVLDPDLGRRSPVVDEQDFPGMRLKRPDGTIVPMGIEVTLGDLDDAQTNHFLDAVEVWNKETNQLIETADDARVLDDPRNAKVVRMAFRAAYDPAEDAIAYKWYYPKFAFGEEGLDDRSCPRPDRELVGFFMIPAERDARRALSLARYSVMDRALRADDIRLESEVASIVEGVRGLGKKLFQKKEFDALVREVESNVDRLLQLNPDSERKLLFELTAMAHYDVVNSLRPFVHLAGRSEPYPVSVQGLGARQIIVLSALRMLAKRKKSSILAVEEPEIGLHPHMQRALVSDLVQSASQVFITTHSVHVAETSGARNVACMMDGGHGGHLVLQADASGVPNLSKDTKRKVQMLAAHYPTEMVDALFAPVVLLVEGIGDRQTLPTLLRKLGQAPGSTLSDLDTLGIAIVPCEGNSNIPDVAVYYRTYLRRRVFALLDGNRSDKYDSASIQTACDCTFLWPKGQAIERVLLSCASEQTLRGYVAMVTEDWGDDYFTNAAAGQTLSLSRLGELVTTYVKGKNAHRSFAEHLPAEEISLAVRNLGDSLTRAIKGEGIGPLLRLTDAAL